MFWINSRKDNKSLSLAVRFTMMKYRYSFGRFTASFLVQLGLEKNDCIFQTNKMVRARVAIRSLKN